MSNLFYIHIHNRDYTDYEFFSNDKQLEKPSFQFDPVEHKLFHNDVFSLNEHNQPCIEVSETRAKKHIPGVLVLQNNKTYGRTENKKRLLYKCIPYDSHLPEFLVPYDLKMDFSKSIHNKYVLFTFQNWNSRHPQGVLCESLGDVHDTVALSEYELYGSHLQHSLKEMNTYVKRKLKPQDEMIEDISHRMNYKLQYKTDQYVFSIDPLGSADFDDAFAIQTIDSHTKITVHIANVALWCEYLELWNYFTDIVSTMYLPHCKKTMLSPILSDQVCSLQQKQKNITMYIEFPILDDGMIDYDNVHFGNSVVKVCKNFVYEESKLLNNQNYQQLFHVSKQLDDNIVDSHDVVSFWMVQVNTYLAKKLTEYDIGLLRSSSLKYTQRLDMGFSREISDALFHYKNASSSYVSTKFGDSQHIIMGKDVYTHITSPIRRKVDLVNQMLLLYRCQYITGISTASQQFMINCMNNIDKINEQTKTIKYIQNKLQLIHLCGNNISVSDDIFEGIVVDKKLDEGFIYHYTIFIHKLNVFLPANLDKELKEYDSCDVRVFLFNDENNIRNKVKIQIM